MTTISKLRLLSLPAVMLCAAFSFAAPAHASDTNLPPFDFSDAFYLANGIDPTTLIGRPNGTPPSSIIDNTSNGNDFNNVRILQQNAAFDHSGHPIFFSVTGLPTLASFTNNAAGAEASEALELWQFESGCDALLPSVVPRPRELLHARRVQPDQRRPDHLGSVMCAVLETLSRG